MFLHLYIYIYYHICVCVRVPVYVTHETTKQCWRCHEICNARQNLPVLSATGPRPFLAVPAPRGGKFAANLWVLSVSKCLTKVVQDFPGKKSGKHNDTFSNLGTVVLGFSWKIGQVQHSNNGSGTNIIEVDPNVKSWNDKMEVQSWVRYNHFIIRTLEPPPVFWA